MLKRLLILLTCLILAACSAPSQATPTPTPGLAATPTPQPSPIPTDTAVATATVVATATAVSVETVVATETVTATPAAAAQPALVPPTGAGGVPAFEHIILILLENHNYKEVIGSAEMPTLNRLAQENVLLTQYYAVAHPSLPNYLALIGGSTFGVKTDCGECYVNAPSLPDRLEVAGRTWKTYQESMPAPCSPSFSGEYDLNHNPFMYFDPIRTDAARCEASVVPLTQLDADLSAGALPNFAFIAPNVCNDAHSCSLATADHWLDGIITRLQASPALGQNSAIFILFDEASADNSSCCGVPRPAGGRIPAVIISPLAKSAFQEDTPLNHYSLLKTILQAWGLPDLGQTASAQPITGVWK